MDSDFLATGDNAGIDAAMLSQLSLKFHHRFMSLKSKWARAFTEVETGYGLLVQDLQLVQEQSSALQRQIGDPIPVDGALPSSLWGGSKLLLPMFPLSLRQ